METPGLKRFFGGLGAAIGGTVITALIEAPLVLYSIGYSIWISRKKETRWAWIKFWIRVFDGILFAAGDFLYAIGYCEDQIWNVTGELIEDTVTHEEETMFTEPEITVSASLGKLKQEGKLNKFGMMIDKALDFAFMQNNHTIGAWLYFQERKRIHKEFFQPKKQ